MALFENMADSFNICSLLINRYSCFTDTGKYTCLLSPRFKGFLTRSGKKSLASDVHNSKSDFSLLWIGK